MPQVDKQNNLTNLVRDALSGATVKLFEDNSVLASLLPVVQSEGSMVYQYNVIDEYLKAQIRDLGENVTGDTFSTTKKVEYLKVLASEMLLDRLYTHGGLGNVINVKSEALANQVVGMANTFNKECFYGDGTDKQLLGLDQRIIDGVAGKRFDATDQTFFDILDEAIDHVSYSTAGRKVIMMNAKTRRRLTKALKSNGLYVETTLEVAGRQCMMYYDTVVMVDNAIKDNEIFVLYLSEVDGLHAVTLNGMTAYEEEARGSMLAIGMDYAVALVTRHTNCFAKVVVA